MTHIEWTQELHVGNQTLDDQHKELFSIANDFVTAIANDQGEAELLGTFNRLREYAEYHFKEEEAYMEMIGYPEQASHSATHAILLVRVGTLQRMISNGEIISPEGAAEFIWEWITTHMMQEDILIEKFIQKQQ